MRPQDVAILLKILALDNRDFSQMQLAGSLSISLSEISESLNRSQVAGLIDFEKKRVNRQNLMEFLEHGVRYVFPQQPGTMVRGVPTAHSHPFMKQRIPSEMNYVWPDPNGTVLGLAIEPFYSKQPVAAKEDDQWYKLLALVDVTRVGKVREIKIAIEALKNYILNHEEQY